MIIDGLTLGALLGELQELNEAKIEKIHQPTRDEVVLLLHAKSGKKRLLLSASASDCRLHLTSSQKENPKQAPNFCMVLRKYLLGGRITEITGFGLDRIAHISIDARDEMGVISRYTLALEMMGKYSNIILLSPEGKVLDSLRRVSLDTSSVRQVLPGVKYALPESAKLNPLAAGKEEIAAAVARGVLPKALVDNLQGISPAAAGELCLRYLGENAPAKAPDYEAFAERIMEFIKTAVFSPRPCVQLKEDGMPFFFSPLPYRTYEAFPRLNFPGVNEAVDAYYTLKEEISGREQLRNELIKRLKKEKTRLEKKLQIQYETVQGGKDADAFLLYGELISAHIYQLKRGQKAAEVNNYYTGEDVRIPLDPTLTPAQNATKYYKRASKMKTGATIALERAAEYEKELSFLSSLEFDAETAKTREDLLEIREELMQFGYMEQPPVKSKARRDPLESPLRFVTSGGFKVLAGRNSRQNDALTLRVAGDKDLWFHAKNMPGSHVILFTNGKEPGEEDILEAASVAAFLSKGKSAGKAAVDYVLRQNVWKQNGARPGMVLYENYRTVMAAADEALVKKLEERETLYF